MRTNPVAVTDDTDQERVGQLFREHGLFVVPVVDHAGRMKGVVTVDDIVAVLDEEATEDMQKTGGVAALDAPYPKATLGSMLRKRGGWLTLLFFGEMLTATAMAWFEEQLARAIVLALFVPLIISSGGNAGSQATTLVIRAMALGEVTSRDWLGVVRREFAVGLALGVLLASIGAVRILLWQELFGLDGYTLRYSLRSQCRSVSWVWCCGGRSQVPHCPSSFAFSSWILPVHRRRLSPHSWT